MQHQCSDQARGLNELITIINMYVVRSIQSFEPLRPEFRLLWERGVRVAILFLKNAKQNCPGEGIVPHKDVAKYLPLLRECDEFVHDIIRSFETLDDDFVYRTVNGERKLHRAFVDENFNLSDRASSLIQEAFLIMNEILKLCSKINMDIVQKMKPTARVREFISTKQPISILGSDLYNEIMENNEFDIEKYMRNREVWDWVSVKEMLSLLEMGVLVWDKNITTENGCQLSITCLFGRNKNRVKMERAGYLRCKRSIQQLRNKW